MLLLATHYRSPIEYGEERLGEIRRSLDGFYRLFERYTRITGGDFFKLEAPTRFAPYNLGSTPSEFLAEMARLRGSFFDSMADDFNTGGAVGVLYELQTALNRFADAKGLEGAAATPDAKAEFQRGMVVLRELSQILGLFREPPTAAKGGNDELANAVIDEAADRFAGRRPEGEEFHDGRSDSEALGGTQSDAGGSARRHGMARGLMKDRIDRPMTASLEAHSSPPRILGVDPGLQITGYAILETTPRGPRICEAGVIRSTEGRATTDMAPRVLALYDGIVEVMDQFKPSFVVVEQLFAHYDHPRTAILMAHARGVVFLAAGQRDLPIVSYNATRIKKTITGNGRASKEQVQRTIQRELSLATLPEPPDVADALAAALCHYYMQKMPA